MTLRQIYTDCWKSNIPWFYYNISKTNLLLGFQIVHTEWHKCVFIQLTYT